MQACRRALARSLYIIVLRPALHSRGFPSDIVALLSLLCSTLSLNFTWVWLVHNRFDSSSITTSTTSHIPHIHSWYEPVHD